jgi:hypothetical protein
VTNRVNMTTPAVRRAADKVVLNMTPQQAQLLAASIWLGDADHTDWLDSLAELLSGAADRGTAFAEGFASSVGGGQSRRRTSEAEYDPGLVHARSDRDGPSGQAPLTSKPESPEAPDLAAFAEAMTTSANEELSIAADLEAVAAAAVNRARDAMAIAAERTLEAARKAKTARAAATTQLAQFVADTVKITALAVRREAEGEAQRVGAAAKRAAELVAMAVTPGTEAASRETATALATTIREAAEAKSVDTATAAAVVARAAATAALEAAATAADAAMTLELEVAARVASVQEVAAATARQVAEETAQAAEAIMTTH